MKDIVLNLIKVHDQKVRLKKHHSKIHKNSKKLVGILRCKIPRKKQGIVYFPFLNQRFIVPLSDLQVIENE